MNKRLLPIALFVAAVLLWGGGLILRLHAQSAADVATMSRANQFYQEGRYEEATGLYLQLLEDGIQDDNLYYNLGNAYFKQDDTGRAILSYQKAAQLNPRDSDIEANLTIARGRAKDKIEANDTAVSRLVTLAQSWLTLDETAAAALALWFVCGGVWLAYRHSQPGHWREAALYGLILAVLLLAGGAFSLGSRLVAERLRPHGVVLAEEVNVLSGPSEQFITEFTLHSGAEVSRIELRDEWARIALPGEQLQGWVPADSLGMIDD
jgi:tetratricopeptide (TPR) repeat protein